MIQNNQLWLGYGFKAGNAYFKIPDSATHDYATGVYDPILGLVKFRNCTWYTNLDIEKRHEDLVFFKRYNTEEYPKYDNYDAINVDKVVDIPIDYNGVLGVPITFLDNYNPNQFEIVRFRKGDDDRDLSINGKCPYFRILIRRRHHPITYAVDGETTLPLATEE